jgi:AraC family transcriptional regulator of adaptative response/methylated-DNA-[protein]-cysteine methyltransferase
VAGTPFQERVWTALSRIPPGRTWAYRELAAAAGVPRAARAVGGAVGANPVALFLPCHRVVRADGSMGGYHWGGGVKAALLRWERAFA